MLRFKIDENLPIEIADLLREAGYEAETVWSEQIQGFSDIELLGICRNEKRVLVTLDMDFSDIRRYRPEDYQGIILLRIASQGKQSVINLFKKVIPHLRYQKLIGYLWIVQKDRIRIRGPER
ncbi:DUF5615 family PIN-like protein [Neomoorella thermoacetica]|uniref:DUF5615 family PIN-like protein n=1 Tax=Neomoorella thermoacetica TaxID=1525 RepID=UPI00090F44BB|nr:DUF5615 family PIN-like protein [Moorella thermoacetica]OIQ58985.1 hypothetical protein MTIN_25520 [Moorella thermoacetica]